MTQNKTDHFEWAKNIKNIENRICPICKDVIQKDDRSFVYLKELYHYTCGYSIPDGRQP